MSQTYILHTNNLTCTSCAAKIEKEIKELDSVTDIKINIFNHTATIIATNNVIDKVNMIVKKHEPDVLFTENEQEIKQKFPKYLLGILAVFISSMIISRAYPNDNLSLVFTIFYMLIYIFTGKNVIRSFFLNLKSGDIFDENFLMFVATAGAIAIGAYEEAAGVMLFYSIGEAFEALAIRKTNNEIFNLASLKPEKAFKIINESPVEILPENIVINDLLLVKTGEITPVEGIIIEGTSDFDLSSITGESHPIFLKKGDKVISGSIPLSGAVTIKAEVDYADSTTSRIVQLISEASSNKSDTEKFITKFAKIYTPVVVALAVLVIFTPMLLKYFGVSTFNSNYSEYLYNGLIFLVISCPCALVLSVPLTYFAGIGKAANNGILIKGSVYLELIRKSDTFIFDKTGTITEGQFIINNIQILSEMENTIDEEQLLQFTASLENYSTHPVANAFKHINTTDIKADDIKEIAGSGILGNVNGYKVAIGNKRILEQFKLDKTSFETFDGVNLFVVINGKATATITLIDNIKSDAPETMSFLHEKRLTTVILSGDSETNVTNTAKQLNITEYHHSLIPEQKIEKMKDYITKNNTITALGDGINDAPLLATSDVGIAMGSTGAALSVEMANIIFLGNKLGKLKTLIEISDKTHRIVMENIIFIMTVKVAIMILGALGYATLWEAVIADVGVALATVLNSIKIFRTKY